MKKSFLEILGILRTDDRNQLDVLSIRGSHRISDTIKDTTNKFDDGGQKYFTDFNKLVGNKKYLNLNVRYFIEGEVQSEDGMFDATKPRMQNIIDNGSINVDSFDALVVDDTFDMLDGVEGVRYIGDMTLEGVAYKLIHITTRGMALTTAAFERFAFADMSAAGLESIMRQVLTYEAKEKALLYRRKELETAAGITSDDASIDNHGFYRPTDTEKTAKTKVEKKVIEFTYDLIKLSSINALMKKIAQGKSLNDGDKILKSFHEEAQTMIDLADVETELEAVRSELNKLKVTLTLVKIHKDANNSWFNTLEERNGNKVYGNLIIKVGTELA